MIPVLGVTQDREKIARFEKIIALIMLVLQNLLLQLEHRILLLATNNRGCVLLTTRPDFFSNSPSKHLLAHHNCKMALVSMLL